MNLISNLQELDQLIVEKTKGAGTSALRNKLASAIEQAEAYQQNSDRQEETLARQIETIAKLQAEKAELAQEISQLKSQNSPQNGPLPAKMKQCPFCLRDTLALRDIVPHEHPDFREMGFKERIFMCVACHKPFRETQKP